MDNKQLAKRVKNLLLGIEDSNALEVYLQGVSTGYSSGNYRVDINLTSFVDDVNFTRKMEKINRILHSGKKIYLMVEE